MNKHKYLGDIEIQYANIYNDLAHEHEVVRAHWWMLDAMGFGRPRMWTDALVAAGPQEDIEKHILTAVVADRLGGLDAEPD